MKRTLIIAAAALALVGPAHAQNVTYRQAMGECYLETESWLRTYQRYVPENMVRAHLQACMWAYGYDLKND
jgi:hypothetical protein